MSEFFVAVGAFMLVGVTPFGIGFGISYTQRLFSAIADLEN